MAWNQNIPQPTDTLSQSQDDILNNFRALNALFTTGLQPAVTFPVQVSNPPTLAGQIALFSKVESATSTQELFLRRVSNGAVIDMTGSVQASNGWTYLPSGLLVKWGTFNATQNQLGTVTLAGSPVPVFNNLFFVIGSQTFGASPDQSQLNNAISFGNYTTTTFQVFPRAIGLPNGNVIPISFLAIGN